MRIVIAHCAIDLAQELHLPQLLQLPPQPRHHIGDFLAHGGGAGRLAVGARQHGGLRGVMCQARQRFSDLLHCWQEHVAHAIAQHQRMSQVVDVFRGTGEVHELRDRLRVHRCRETLLDEILHRLHVVIGGRLDILDASGIHFTEIVVRIIERLIGRLDRLGTSSMPSCAARHCSQRISTSTRRLIRPNSLNTSRSGSVLLP